MKIANLVLMMILLTELGWVWSRVGTKSEELEVVETPAIYRVILPDVEFQDPYYEEELKALAPKAERDANGLLEMSDALLAGGFYVLAAEHYAQVLEEFPEHLPARFKLAFCLDRSGQIEKSTVEYEKVVGVQPLDEMEKQLIDLARYSMGRNYLRLEDGEKAEEVFSKHEGFVPSQVQYAKLLVRSGRDEEAIPVLDRGLEQSPFSLTLHFWKARALEGLGKWEEAMVEYRQVERGAYLLPTDFRKNIVEQIQGKFGTPKKLDRIESLANQGQFLMAGSELDEVLSRLPKTSIHAYEQALQLRGEIALRQQDPIVISKVTGQLRDLESVTAKVIAFEAAAAYLQSQMEKAKEKWETLLRLETSERACRNLETVYRASGREDLARQMRVKAFIAEGWRLFRENKLEEADQRFLTAKELDGSSVEAWYGHAEMAHYLGDLEAAKEGYERVLELEPRSGRAERGLRVLEFQVRTLAK